MPIYPFQCQNAKCSHEWELEIPMGNYLGESEGCCWWKHGVGRAAIRCPKCKTTKVSKIFGKVSVTWKTDGKTRGT